MERLSSLANVALWLLVGVMIGAASLESWRAYSDHQAAPHVDERVWFKPIG